MNEPPKISNMYDFIANVENLVLTRSDPYIWRPIHSGFFYPFFFTIIPGNPEISGIPDISEIISIISFSFLI